MQAVTHMLPTASLAACLRSGTAAALLQLASLTRLSSLHTITPHPPSEPLFTATPLASHPQPTTPAPIPSHSTLTANARTHPHHSRDVLPFKPAPSSPAPQPLSRPHTSSFSSSPSPPNSNPPSTPSDPRTPPSGPSAPSLAKKLQQEELWLGGIEGAITRWGGDAYPALKGRDKELSSAVREAFLQLLQAHAAGRLLDDAARRQLKLVCLAVATHQVLEGEGVSREHASQLVALNLGSLFSPFFTAAMKGSVWVKARLLGRDPWDLAVDTLRNVGVDMAGGCQCDVREEGEGGAERVVMEVRSCQYQEVLRGEGVEHLLGHFCCSFNMTWFGVYEGYGVGAERTSWLAGGDECCRIVVAKK